MPVITETLNQPVTMLVQVNGNQLYTGIESFYEFRYRDHQVIPRANTDSKTDATKCPAYAFQVTDGQDTIMVNVKEENFACLVYQMRQHVLQSLESRKQGRDCDSSHKYMGTLVNAMNPLKGALLRITLNKYDFHGALCRGVPMIKSNRPSLYIADCQMIRFNATNVSLVGFKNTLVPFKESNLFMMTAGALEAFKQTSAVK